MIIVDRIKSRTDKKFNSNSLEKTAPVGLTATAGDLDGEIDLVWEPVNGANSYIIQVNRSENRNVGWIQEDVISRSSYTISRLKSGYKYWFRVAAAGSRGQSLWSESVNKKAP